MFRKATHAALRGALIVSLIMAPSTAHTQAGGRVADSLVAHALTANRRLQAAEARAAGARSRIAPAGAWPDPMLMAGIENLPISREKAAGHATTVGPDPMTMKMLGVRQSVPYPGKTPLRTAAARADAEAAEARLASVRRDVRRQVLNAYYELVAARSSLSIIERQQHVATSVLPAAEARYVAGTAAQSDVLKARTEAALLVEERNSMLQQERAALARLNAVLDRAGSTPVVAESFPEDLVGTKSLPALDSLTAIALQTNPRLRERRAVITAQIAQRDLNRKEYLPDFDVSIQYGQRDRLPDMITATIGVPLPIQRGRKQTAIARAAQFDVVASEAELRSEENELRAEIARTRAAVERDQANLELLHRAILPQARATFASASASYQSGRGELLNVLDAMRALFATETMRVRTLSELAKSVTELQALVGEDVLR
jgi:cobalt-zinc-cadmium efflux system outer membrane protein